MSALRRIGALLLVLGRALAWAQEGPNSERGVRPGLAYRVDGIDQINLFNGTVTMNVPIGPTYPVGGTLSYALMASYATNSWGRAVNVVDDTTPGKITEYNYMYPAKYTNAGFGWVVTLGQIIENVANPGSDPRTYLAPDGSQHKFELKLHTKDPNEVDISVAYTRDGTYLRMRRRNDGGWTLELPNGHIHEFNAQGLLTEMRDPFGNKVTVEYKTRRDFTPSDPNPDSTVWVIKDTRNREHKVWFRPGWFYKEDLWDNPPVPHEIVDQVELLAFGGKTATYRFNYDVPPQDIPPGGPAESLKTHRRVAPRQDANVPAYVIVSLLSSIELLPTASDSTTMSYAFLTDRTTEASGNITQLTLPTGGRITWTYQPYRFPIDQAANRGIWKRTTYDGTTKVGETEYILDRVEPANILSDPIRLVVNRDGSDVALNATRHYFSGCRSQTFCSHPGDYGLPLTRTQAAGPGYLSTEFIAPDANGNLTNVLRRTYVAYEGDMLFGDVPLWTGINQRRSYERTVYADDADRYAEVTYSSFDGLGHYRKATTGGTFPSGNVRTTFTSYNSARGTYELDSSGNLKPGYLMLSKTAKWVLNTYDTQWVAEADAEDVEQHAVTKSCFDASGLLTSRRTYKSFWAPNGTTVADKDRVPTATTSDLLAVFTYGGGGNMTREQYLGGDKGSGAPTGHTCGSAYGSESYRIDHAYSNGTKSASWYVDGSGAKMSFYLDDRTIDATGLTSASRQFRPTTAGAADVLLTEYDYDQLGRVTKATTSSRTYGDTLEASARTTYAYALNPPAITTTDQKLGPSPAVVGLTTAEFDRLGRLVRETRRMPDERTSSRSTTYNSLGWKVRTRDWGATEETVYAYDALGRPVAIRAPDQSDTTATTINYTGATAVTRETSVRTGGDPPAFTFTSAATKEEYDRQGRLIRVTEPPTAAGGTARPVTEYRYDAGDRLIQVCTNKSGTACGQSRTFAYDGRGFLTKEVHPESGTTTYTDYDGRGHVGRRYVSTPYSFDLGYVYDRAERLTDLRENLSSTDDRPLKHFDFFEGNRSVTSLENGQLDGAVRFNWLPGDSSVKVWEKYLYDAEGRPKSRTTTEYICEYATADCEELYSGSVGTQFTQGFTHAPDVRTTTYPTCTVGCDVAGPARTVTESYDHGRLKSVAWDQSAASLDYHDSGLITEITHPNAVKDSQTPDAPIVSRPERIVTSGITLGGVCVAPAFTTHPLSTSIAAGGSATLTALASGETGQAISYTWYRGTAPDKSTPAGSESASLTVSPATTTSYWVEAANGCGIANSQTATISVCTLPTLRPPPDDTITLGQTARLVASVTSQTTTPVAYQWYSVTGGMAAISGATSKALNVSPSQTTTYRVTATNDCGSDSDDVVLTVLAPPTPPTAVTAAYVQSANHIRVSWAPSASAVGVASYRIDRSDGVTIAPLTNPYDDPAIVSGKAYVYRLRAIDSNGISSEASDPDVASVVAFTDDPAGGTPIRALHISELRRAVDEIRQLAGLPPAWTTYDPPAGVVPAADFTVIRDRLNDARLSLQLPFVDFIDPVEKAQPIRGNAINTLRGGVK